MRASAMFSIFVIGENIQRKPNIYNSLAASAFFLLLINPNNLFDIGFQLSYAAVFGIVFLQPKLEKLILVKNKFLKFFWSLVTVSIAAQIATFPITTYYFGQFPTYFWITNTFVIPAVMILIPMGILLLFVSKIQIISNALAIVLNVIIKSTYFLLSSINDLPFSVIELSISQIQFIFIAAMVCSVLFYLNNQKIYFIKATLFFTLLLSLSTLIADINRLNNTEVIIYNTTKNPGIHLINGKENYIITEEKIKDEEIYFHPGTITKRKLGLNRPVFLVSTDSLINDNILLKNRLIFFEGKLFSFNRNNSGIEREQFPDFLINPINTEFDTIEFKPVTTVITNKRFFDKNSMNSNKIHYTLMKGAFRKKW
jgi:competence protein ComEC